MVANRWSKFVLILWLFVAYVLMQSYTAKLSSNFTVDQLDFELSEKNYVGHQLGSYVKDFLMNELRLNQSKLRGYKSFEQYHEAMTRGSRNGGVDAIAGEVPYMKLFVNRYSSEYRIARRTYKNCGFGFAFPMGSPLVSYFSKAILNITQGPIMTEIEKKNFGPGYPSDAIDRDSSNLEAFNFGGLFIIMSFATMVALFCSEASVGQRFAIMASVDVKKWCSFTGQESSAKVISIRDVSGESLREESREFRKSKVNVAEVLVSQGEAVRVSDASSGPTAASASARI